MFQPHSRRALVCLLTLFAPLQLPQQLIADDTNWPMWRHDVGRSGATSEPLPTNLQLSWTRRLPPPQTAWPVSQFKLRFDGGYELVCSDNMLLFGSTLDGSISAVHADSGELQWKFYTDGPVRFAPVIVGQRVYVVSDDGRLYCLDLATGSRHWAVQGGPSRRHIIGNNRLTSMWPARGGVVVHEGVAYFASGLWPSLGVFVRAVDAATGKGIWTNSTTGSQFVTHPHNTDAFGMISPQGHLAISGNHLIVPGGRTLPGVFDLKTGELQQFKFGAKGEGGHHVLAYGDYCLVRGAVFQLSDGVAVGKVPADVVGAHGIVGRQGANVVVTTSGRVAEKPGTDRRGEKTKTPTFKADKVTKHTVDGPSAVFLQTGDLIFTSEKGKIAAYNLTDGAALKSRWTAEVEGDVWSMIAAAGRLYVTTEQGDIFCFASTAVAPGPGPVEVATIERSFSSVADAIESDSDHQAADELAAFAESAQGYGLAIGRPSFSTIDQLLARSGLSLIVAESLEVTLDEFRQDAGLDPRFGTRVSAVSADVFAGELPPYLASFAFCEKPQTWDRSQLESLFEILRPYGGVCCLRTTAEQHAGVVQQLKAANLYGETTTRDGNWTLIRRKGPLEDAGVWTHQNGDASGSSVSADARVKAPLGLLWFGGPPNDKVLPRHGHGPSPQVAGGRLFIEGADMLRCVDVYTGRVWWERDFKDLGKFYNNTSHHPGAGEIGSNYVSLEDHVYLIHGKDLLELDAQTGKTTKTFRLPADRGVQPQWGGLLVEGDVLLAAASPVAIPDLVVAKGVQPPNPAPPIPLSEALTSAEHSSASRKLYAFRRATGELLWSRAAEKNFRHNAICASDSTVFCIDALSPEKVAFLKRRGVIFDQSTQLLALDLLSGKVRWSTEENVTGTFLNYSREHGILIQGGSSGRDRAKDETAVGMIAYRGSNGDVLWSDLGLKYSGPCLLNGTRLITNGSGGFELDMLTGKKTGWTYTRMYGCNSAVASKHLLTFRSGAAGFFDLEQDSGTGNFGGFRSSCTSNLIVADGVLNAPDYTRTCVCAYQMQTSLALIHMPEVESWTFGNAGYTKSSVDNLGLNLGAPGDRRDDEGILWFDFPISGGPSPKLEVTTTPKAPKTFSRHSSLLDSAPRNWVASSGFRDLSQLNIKAKLLSKRVTVTLIFTEPDDLAPGKRVFSVSLNGQPALVDFDVSAESQDDNASPSQTTVTREFTGIAFDGELTIDLAAKDGSAAPVLSGVSLRAESQP